MANKKPLIVKDGQVQELSSTDKLDADGSVLTNVDKNQALIDLKNKSLAYAIALG